MDLLDFVRSKLKTSKGQLRNIATQSGVSYDTVLRVRNGKVDPGYSKVRALADHLAKTQ